MIIEGILMSLSLMLIGFGPVYPHLQLVDTPSSGAQRPE